MFVYYVHVLCFEKAAFMPDDDCLIPDVFCNILSPKIGFQIKIYLLLFFTVKSFANTIWCTSYIVQYFSLFLLQ